MVKFVKCMSLAQKQNRTEEMALNMQLPKSVLEIIIIIILVFVKRKNIVH